MKRYRLVNDAYGSEGVLVTADELRTLLTDVFDDYDTVIEDRGDGLYESDGTLVAVEVVDA